MEYSRLPVRCMKPITEFIQDQEQYFASQHSGVTVHRASADDIAKFEADAAAKVKREALTCCISAEIGSGPKREKKPEVPFEDIPRRPQRLEPQYEPVMFDRKVAG